MILTAEQRQELTVDAQGAADMLGMHPETVKAKARSGEIPGCKPGRAWVFIVADLLDYLRTLQTAPPWPSSSTSEAQTSTPASPHRTESEYFKALGLPTEEAPKNTRPDLRLVSGEKSS